jgi:hypothetical protein
MTTLLWIGGWASEFGALSARLRTLAPEATWIALDPHAIADEPVQLDNALASFRSLPSPALILAWSLGALQLMRHMQVTGNELPCPALLLHPVDRLVGDQAPWPTRVLQRMRRRLREEPGETLCDFWKLAHGASKSPLETPPGGNPLPVTLEAWRRAAMDLGTEALDAGLSDLQQGVSERQAHHPEGRSLWVMGNPEDTVCPFRTEAWRNQWPAARLQTVGSGHFFFQYDMAAIQSAIIDMQRAAEGQA